MTILEIHKKCYKILADKQLKANCVSINFKQFDGEVTGLQSPLCVEIEVELNNEAHFTVRMADKSSEEYSMKALLDSFKKRCCEISSKNEIQNITVDI